MGWIRDSGSGKNLLRIPHRDPGVQKAPESGSASLVSKGRSLAATWQRWGSKKPRFLHCCGSALVSTRIRIQHFRSMRIWIRVQSFDDKKLREKIKLKKISFLINCSLLITRPTSKPQAKPSALEKEHPAL